MPNIREYSAPSGKINPDEKGYAAYETAGRRIGPLYNQAAQDVEKGGKLDDQLISQLERLTDEQSTPEVLKGSRSGGGGGSGRATGGGAPRIAGVDSLLSGGVQSSTFNNYVDPIDAANAAKWAARTARKLTGSPGNGGGLDELEWEQSNGGLTQDEQRRYKMLSDIQTKKDNAAMDLANQKQLAAYKADRDATVNDWYKQQLDPTAVDRAQGKPFSYGSNTGQSGDFSSATPDAGPGVLSAIGNILSSAWNGITSDNSGQPSAQALVSATVDAEQTGAEQ